jgi:hypothetical protein
LTRRSRVEHDIKLDVETRSPPGGKAVSKRFSWRRWTQQLEAATGMLTPTRERERTATTSQLLTPAGIDESMECLADGGR